MGSAFSPHLTSMLREYDIHALNFSDNIVIERVLQFGEMNDYRQLKKQIGKKMIIDFFVKHRANFDRKTANFREKMFNLPHLPPSPTLYEQLHASVSRRNIG